MIKLVEKMNDDLQELQVLYNNFYAESNAVGSNEERWGIRKELTRPRSYLNSYSKIRPTNPCENNEVPEVVKRGVD
jgi:hypothetical protein